MLDKIRKGCSVGFFGLGRSNLSLLRTLPLSNCRITLRSDGEIDRNLLPGAAIYSGKDALKELREDILFLSPSVRRDRPELRSVRLCSDYELFLGENERPLFAITGSDGKSTTARLLSLLLCEGGTHAEEVGNMGVPMYSALAKKCDAYVAELSSFMLATALPRARVAALTSLSPNHLDWHGSYENYKKTKINLLKASEKFVISDENADIGGAFGIVSLRQSYGELRSSYGAELYITCEGGYIRRNGEPILDMKLITRNEEHNIKNLMLAIAMADGNCAEEEIRRVADGFRGLPHRCELFFSDGQIDFFDSSIDTSPARTRVTLQSLGRRVVIILGGRGKGLDYAEMLPELTKYAEAAVLFGENKHEIKSAISRAIPCFMAEDFDEAVNIGKEKAHSVGALLLSPASASYDSFKNYEERGDTFKKLVKGLWNEENLS